MHPLGLKASVVHDHCKRRRSGHRTNNLLKTLDVKGSQYPPVRRALCLRKHKLHLVTRLVDIHTLALMCAGVPTLSNFAANSLSLAFSEFVRTGAHPVSEFQTAVSTSSGDQLQNRGNHGWRHTLQEHTHRPFIK